MTRPRHPRGPRERRAPATGRHHDHSYKQLFSHAEMVRDLLTGFVREDWVASLDLASQETVKGSYVTESRPCSSWRRRATSRPGSRFTPGW